MSSAQRIVCTDDAPWLPPGSCAEVWVGDGCVPPDPSIIVRLLLTSTDQAGVRTFFCVPTQKGLDLPALFLGGGPERINVEAGLDELQRTIVGEQGLPLRCVGWVRNVVPTPNASYPHPTPYAHVPVFIAPEGTTTAVEGAWITLEGGRDGLAARHWWPIVEHTLASRLAGEPITAPAASD